VILVDTSVWVGHLRSGDAALSRLLEEGRVLTHPFVIGELALGSLRQRETVLGALHNLTSVAKATDDEVMIFVDRHRLYGIGIGYVDAHLLAAVSLTPGASLWTQDKRLRAAAESLSLGRLGGIRG
jgi:predicted nucleic acid-binding protein